MEELEKNVCELIETLKNKIDRRRNSNEKLYFYEWAEYYSLLKESIKLGLSKETKSKFLELLLRDDFVEVDEENQEIFNNMKNELCFERKSKSRLKTK